LSGLRIVTGRGAADDRGARSKRGASGRLQPIASASSAPVTTSAERSFPGTTAGFEHLACHAAKLANNREKSPGSMDRQVVFAQRLRPQWTLVSTLRGDDS
jgi:hypothetical protein